MYLKAYVAAKMAYQSAMAAIARLRSVAARSAARNGVLADG